MNSGFANSGVIVDGVLGNEYDVKWDVIKHDETNGHHHRLISLTTNIKHKGVEPGHIGLKS